MLYLLISGQCSITAAMALRLEQALGIAAETWLRMRADHELAQLRGKASSLNVQRLAPT